MLYEIMNHINNFFLVEGAVRSGVYEIKNGDVTLPFLMPGQYYLVVGSVFNDGVHRYKMDELLDERFSGDIAPLAPPKAFLNLCEEIAEWQKTSGQKALEPYQSESFAGYSYTKASGKNGGAYSWKNAFASQLNTWRKI